MVPVLETERLTLRGHRLDDFESSAALWADPEVVRYITGKPLPRDTSWHRLLRYVGHWDLLGYGYWVVEDRDGRFIGEVGLADYHRNLDIDVAGIPEAGWVLATHAHGKGYATEAMTRVLQWADERFARTFAMFDPAHEKSMHVAAKLGYGDRTEAKYNGEPAVVLWRDRPDG
ncbi:GNAT family N-acetyltransferase [Pseudoruegeria sp. HB172150]|uniref:GNAT family N-acetyltransferase n=1 Tax=Pseudoruegeria sp. HB172150 TaxID=2721164 RepID=UPI0015539586|nr:GNAT family N-acetyltransferase [Pseudoruegeria sp. HB172150]